MKQCRKCNEIKEFKEFNIRKEGKDGYYNACKVCRNMYALKPEYKEMTKKWIKNNKAKNLQTKKRYRDKNKSNPNYIERQRINRLATRLRNPEKAKETCRQWKKDNPGVCTILTNKRRTAKISSQIPLSEEKNLEMVNIFKKAGELRKIYGKRSAVVDHIIPLLHPKVCGLNVPWNLQILTSYENAFKHNKFDGTYENNSWRSNLSFIPVTNSILNSSFNLVFIPRI
jgi:hypothetical protein